MKKLFTFASLALLISASVSVPNPRPAHAVTASDWKAGRIIDDALFTNASDMSVNDIQSFLNSRVPNCDTWGTQPAIDWGRPDLTRAQYAATRGWPGPPYVCLRNYYEVPKSEPGPGVPVNSFQNGGNPPAGSISAAQMIYNAAQRYQINPKALLVTIQKESIGPLTTDTWPLEKQYTYAMGAYCPDSGPGGSANCDPNYAGFSIQIAQSARLMRYYLDNMQQPWWAYKKPFQNNYILWNVEPTGCGGGNVYVETKATAALYTYTPYQPNAAALNNMYGTGDRCSAYGNRNFWRIWNDWFGRTRFFLGTKPSQNSLYSSLPCNIVQEMPLLVSRLYNPDSQDYLFTRSQPEACSAIRLGYIWDGFIATSEQETTPNTRPIYRLRAGINHYYTADYTDFREKVNLGMADEGIVMYGLSNPDSQSIPCYSLKRGSTSVFTCAGGEGANLVNDQGFSSNGVIFYTHVSNQNSKPVFRLNKFQQRLLTQSDSEKTNALNDGYISEGIVSNNGKVPDEHNLPVYRLMGPKGHFYTSSRNERDLAVIDYDYKSEGSGWYTLTSSHSGVMPIYRQSNYWKGGLRLYTGSIEEKNNARTYFGYTDEGIGWYSNP